MQGLKGTKQLQKPIKTLSLNGLAIFRPAAIHVCRWPATSWGGGVRGRLASIHNPRARVTSYDLRMRSEHSPLTGSKGGHSLHSIKHSSNQPEASW